MPIVDPQNACFPLVPLTRTNIQKWEKKNKAHGPIWGLWRPCQVPIHLETGLHRVPSLDQRATPLQVRHAAGILADFVAVFSLKTETHKTQRLGSEYSQSFIHPNRYASSSTVCFVVLKIVHFLLCLLRRLRPVRPKASFSASER